MGKALSVLLLVACLCIGTVQSRSLNQLGAAAAQPAAAALPAPAAAALPAPAAATAAAEPAAAGPVAAAAALPAAAAAAPAKPANSWVQRDGYVPLPKVMEEPAAAPAPASTALPPANNFGAFTAEPAPADPTGTNVFADPKYAPAAVRAAYEAQNPTPEANLPSAGGVAAPAPAGVMPGGMTPPGAQAGGSSSVFDGPAGGMGGGMGGAPGAAGGAGDGVFASNGAAWGNRYVPSVGNAIGSLDILVKMGIDAPEQQAATSGDLLRASFANATQTPIDRIYVYQTRTVNSAAGQPSTELTLLFKNPSDVDRARQQNVLLSTDVMRGFIANAAQRTGLKIQQGSIRVSPAVNDGGAMTANGAGPMMPGQLPGLMPGMGPGFGANPGAPAAAEAPAAPKNGAAAAAAQLALPLLAALAALVAL